MSTQTCCKPMREHQIFADRLFKARKFEPGEPVFVTKPQISGDDLLTSVFQDVPVRVHLDGQDHDVVVDHYKGCVGEDECTHGGAKILFAANSHSWRFTGQLQDEVTPTGTPRRIQGAMFTPDGGDQTMVIAVQRIPNEAKPDELLVVCTHDGPASSPA